MPVLFNVYGAPELIPRMNSASLCSLAGRYDNPIPPRCLAPIGFLKIPALEPPPFKYGFLQKISDEIESFFMSIFSLLHEKYLQINNYKNVLFKIVI